MKLKEAFVALLFISMTIIIPAMNMKEPAQKSTNVKCEKGCCKPMPEAFHKSIKDKLSAEVQTIVAEIEAQSEEAGMRELVLNTFTIQDRHLKDIDKKGPLVWLKEKTQINPEPATNMLLSRKNINDIEKAVESVILEQPDGKYIIPVVDVPGYKEAKINLQQHIAAPLNFAAKRKTTARVAVKETEIDTLILVADKDDTKTTLELGI